MDTIIFTLKLFFLPPNRKKFFQKPPLSLINQRYPPSSAPLTTLKKCTKKYPVSLILLDILETCNKKYHILVFMTYIFHSFFRFSLIYKGFSKHWQTFHRTHSKFRIVYIIILVIISSTLSFSLVL